MDFSDVDELIEVKETVKSVAATKQKKARRHKKPDYYSSSTTPATGKFRKQRKSSSLDSQWNDY